MGTTGTGTLSIVLPERAFPLPFAVVGFGAVTLSEGPGISSRGVFALARGLGFGSCGVSSMSVEIVRVLALAFAFGTGMNFFSSVADRGRRLGAALATAVGGPGISSSSWRLALLPRGALATPGTGICSSSSSLCLALRPRGVLVGTGVSGTGTSSFAFRRPPARVRG